MQSFPFVLFFLVYFFMAEKTKIIKQFIWTLLKYAKNTKSWQGSKCKKVQSKIN